MKIRKIFTVLAFGIVCVAVQAAERVYETTPAFLETAFDGRVPEAKIIWFSGKIKTAATAILGHKPRSLRTRYWQRGQRSVWILEEIGKEKPITTGFIINQNQIEQVRVLTFRESRGWEIKRKAFVAQYTGARLEPNLTLNGHIDGISGATLSVQAVNKLARLALYLHQTVIPPQSAQNSSRPATQP